MTATMTKDGLLRDNVDFRRYWIGQAASDLGTQLSLVAYPLLVLALGGTAAQAGGIASGSLLTRMICRLPAGVVVDRFDRRTIMLGSDLVRAVALASIPGAALLGGLTYLHILLVAVVEGAASSVFRPAAMVAVRQMVPADQLTVAMARSQSRAAAVSLIGPALGGLLFTLQRLVPFVVDAVSYLVSALLVSRISTPLGQRRSTSRPDWRLAAGISWLLRRRVLRNVFVFAGVINMIAVSVVLVVVVTAEAQGRSGTTIGLLLACVGVGAVAGAAAAPTFLRMLSASAVFIGLGVGWIITAAVLIVTSAPWAVGAVLAAQFVLSPVGGIVVGKAMLLGAPDEFQGRVVSAADLLMSGLAALGPLLTGFLLDVAGVRDTLFILAALAALATAACLPTIRTPGFLAESDPAQVPAYTGGSR
jgi:MFS family permease